MTQLVGGGTVRLMILESGAKSRTIKKYLGEDWIVEACRGHIKRVSGGKSRFSAKEGELPDAPWSWSEGSEVLINKILNRAEESDVKEVYIATDPDREGELIAWHLDEVFSEFDEVKRVTFQEITESAVIEAVNNPQGIDMDLVHSALVRFFVDRLVGFKCSKFSRSWNLPSMGRVQTPTLGFIVQRELEREAHVPIEYHSVHVDSDEVRFNVRFHEKDDGEAWTDDSGKHNPARTADTELAEAAFNALENADSIRITSVNEGKRNRNPQPPFMTDTLLQTASSTLGWRISKTQKMARDLFDAGHITYIRTDSTRTSPEAQQKIREYIKKKFGDDHLGPGAVGSDAKKGATNVQDAHEAIRPTRPDKISISKVGSEQHKLYDLIWARFAASQMSASIREKRDLRAAVDGLEKPLTGTVSWRVHAGWEEVYTKFQKDVRTSPPESPLEEGGHWSVSKSDKNPLMVTDETKPPDRFTESSIIRQMKKEGIGRPSTYVSTVKKLVDKKYIGVDGSSLVPNQTGRDLILVIVPFFNEQSASEGLFSTEFTAKMEEQLDNIANPDTQGEGARYWKSFEEEFGVVYRNAVEERRKKPTIKQMDAIIRRLELVSEARQEELLGGKSIEDLSGDEAREIRSTLNEEIDENGSFPPSEKQTSLILDLSEQFKMSIDEVLGLVGVADISELTGGRDGTASELISILIEKSKTMPATPPQVDLVNKLADQHEMSINEVLAIVGLKEIGEMTKSDASDIINEMKKRARRSGKRGSGA